MYNALLNDGLCHTLDVTKWFRDFRTPETGQRVGALPYAMSQSHWPNYQDLENKCSCTRLLMPVCLPAVSTLPQKGCQQASDHVAASEAVQEPDHLGLQDAGPGTHQHG